MFPRLADLGGFTLHSYGVLLVVAVFTAIAVGTRLLRTQGIPFQQGWNLGVVSVLASYAGARALLVVNDWQYYSAHPRALFSLTGLQSAGVYYGGLIAAVLAAIVYIRANHLPMLKIIDAETPAIALGHAIGKLGCFAAGCCYGKPTTLPWAVTFTDPWAQRLFGTPLAIGLHPTQLYDAAIEFADFGLLVWLLRRKRFDGQVAAAYMAIYGFCRYFLEFVRDDPQRGSVFGGLMTGTQLISLLLFIAGGALWMIGPLLAARLAPVPATPEATAS